MSKSLQDRLMDCFIVSNMWKGYEGILSKSETTSSQSPTGLEKESVVDVLRLLEDAGFRPVIAGSIASMAYSVGRMTHDLDINIILNEKEYSKLVKVLSSSARVTQLGNNDGILGTNTSHLPLYLIHFRYDNMNVNILLNSNWITDYAIRQARDFQFDGNSLRVLSPESVCFFKFINADDDITNESVQKDMYDVNQVLKYVKEEEEELKTIYNYVKSSLTKLECQKQLDLWEKLIQKVFDKRLKNKAV